MVSVYIRLANGEKEQFAIELNATVKDLKNMIAESQQVECDRITLVFKGKIMKDTDSLEESGRFCLFWTRYRCY